jgi:hypothetical protein
MKMSTRTICFLGWPELLAPSRSFSNVSRSSDLTVTWSGGAAGGIVAVMGSSADPSSGAEAQVSCVTQADAGTFSVRLGCFRHYLRVRRIQALARRWGSSPWLRRSRRPLAFKPPEWTPASLIGANCRSRASSTDNRPLVVARNIQAGYNPYRRQN